MKAYLILVVILFFSPILSGQNIHSKKTRKSMPIDTIIPGRGTPEHQLKKISQMKINKLSDSAGVQPRKSALVDTTKQNKYGDKLNDDTAFNKCYPVWKPAVEVLGILGFIWTVDRFVLNADYSHVGITTWNTNIKKEWVWDNDKFGVNFIGHPYAGSLYFNAARSQGYNYFQSFPFAVGGSLLWEYFGENTLPSINDMIYTPVNGAFLGEILYRLSSNILDDRTRGANRVFREIAAGLIDPVRGLNRLLQGKSFRRTTMEVYQKEPINIILYSGLQAVTNSLHEGYGNATYSSIINFQTDYGNPFEVRPRKPFDLFRVRVNLNLGAGSRYIDNLTGYGILFGRNFQQHKVSLLVGAMQYYDYWNNRDFELGTIGFGGGVSTRLPAGTKSTLYTRVDLAGVPFAGNSTHFGPDTATVRDYNYSGGMETKFESSFNLGNYGTASLFYYFYLLVTYVGAKGTNYIHILRPRISITLYKNLSIRGEYFIYYNDRAITNFPVIHSDRTELKIFLQIYLEDPQRRGHYD